MMMMNKGLGDGRGQRLLGGDWDLCQKLIFPAKGILSSKEADISP